MREGLPRVLLVDDDPSILETLTVMLEASGFACRTAANGFEALKILRLCVPDVMISDLRMPHMSGYELLPVVRRRYPELKLIVMSAEDQESIQPLGLPVDAYLQKGGNAPFLLQTLIRKVLSEPGVAKEAVEERDENPST